MRRNLVLSFHPLGKLDANERADLETAWPRFVVIKWKDSKWRMWDDFGSIVNSSKCGTSVLLGWLRGLMGQGSIADAEMKLPVVTSFSLFVGLCSTSKPTALDGPNFPEMDLRVAGNDSVSL